MRIWWQSFVDPVQNAPYLERLSAYLGEIADEGTSVDVHGVTPPDRDFGRLTEFRCAILAVDNALESDEQGYDAFVMGHFQDPGLYEARSAVAIPVLGLGELALHWASLLGRHIALVSIDPVFDRWHREQADLYGVGSRVTHVTGLGLVVEDFAPAFAGDAAAYGHLLTFPRPRRAARRGGRRRDRAGGRAARAALRPGARHDRRPLRAGRERRRGSAEACRGRDEARAADRDRSEQRSCLRPGARAGDFRALVAHGRGGAHRRESRMSSIPRGQAEIVRLDLNDQVYEAIKARLLTREFGGGQKISLQTLADQLGVSRSPVHHALTRLTTEGFVNSEPRGYVVRPLTADLMDELYEARLRARVARRRAHGRQGERRRSRPVPCAPR